MSEFSNIFFFGLPPLSVIVAVASWHWRNRKLLTAEDHEKARRLFRKDSWNEAQLALLIPISFILIFGLHISEDSFGFAKAPDLIFIFLLLPLGYGILRNYKIHRKSDLPREFVRGELALGIFMLSAYALMVVFIFTD